MPAYVKYSVDVTSSHGYYDSLLENLRIEMGIK